jgi:hypothetical protein
VLLKEVEHIELLIAAPMAGMEISHALTRDQALNHGGESISKQTCTSAMLSYGIVKIVVLVGLTTLK